jgi:hypothetical protein
MEKLEKKLLQNDKILKNLRGLSHHTAAVLSSENCLDSLLKQKIKK